MWRADTVLWVWVGAHRASCWWNPQGGNAPPEVLADQPISTQPDEAPAQALVHPTLSSMAEQAAKALIDRGVPARRRVVRALVSDAWAPAWSLPWRPEMANPAEAVLYAVEHIRSLGFPVGTADVLRVTEPAYFRPAVAVVYGADLMSSLGRVAHLLGASLDSVQMFHEVVWRASRIRLGRRLGGVAMLEGPRVGLIQAQPRGAGWMPGQATVCPADAQTDALAATLWRRRQLREPRLLESELDVQRIAAGESFDGEGEGPRQQSAHAVALIDALVRAPGAWKQCSELDAVRSRRRLSFAQIALGCVATGFACGAVLQGIRANEALNLQRDALNERQMAVSPRPAKGWTETDRKRVRAVNAAIRELNLPMGALARAMVPPKDIHVSLLSLDIAPAAGGRAKLSITADAAKAADMTRYLSFLAERQNIARPQLVRHEVLEAKDAKAYRFTVEVAWQE